MEVTEINPPQPVQEQPTTTEVEPKDQITQIMNHIKDVNEQLGGDVVVEKQFKGTDHKLILFKKVVFLGKGFGTPVQSEYQPDTLELPLNGEDLGMVFGVDSYQGPGYFTRELAEGLLNESGDVDETKLMARAEGLADVYFQPVKNERDLKMWEATFNKSKDSVLQDQEKMKQLREQKAKLLGDALNIVSKPVDLNPPRSSNLPPAPPINPAQ